MRSIIWIILINFIVFGCFETALAQQGQEESQQGQEESQTPWVSLKAVRQMKLDIQSVVKDTKNGINYLKEKAKEKVRQGRKGIVAQLKEGLKDYGRSFFEQIKWGIDKLKQGSLKIKDFFVNLFKKI